MTRQKPDDKVPASEKLILRVAGLGLWLEAGDSNFHLSVPPCHVKFLTEHTSEFSFNSEVSPTLRLSIQNTLLPETNSWKSPICHSETWELWMDDADRFVFVTPHFSPPHRLVITDSKFTSGEVLGAFTSNAEFPTYPLQDIDIRLYVNWLANFGDLLLHAAGVAIHGQGYCFIGPSGAGKSTLAVNLARNGNVTVLGEDQVILRYMDGQFWIFGTPWHIEPKMCSPLGVPLKKLFILDRSADKPIKQTTPIDGITHLLQTSFFPYYRSDAVGSILDRLKLLSEVIPFYILAYQLGSDLFKLIR